MKASLQKNAVNECKEIAVHLTPKQISEAVFHQGGPGGRYFYLEAEFECIENEYRPIKEVLEKIIESDRYCEDDCCGNFPGPWGYRTCLRACRKGDNSLCG